MIFIVVKFETAAEFSERWPDLVTDFTAGTRSEEGNLFFDWARSVDNPREYVFTEGFSDGAAEAHVGSDHFAAAVRDLPQYLTQTPKIISQTIDAEGWAPMAEMTIE